jgi:hypothetical protein
MAVNKEDCRNRCPKLPVMVILKGFWWQGPQFTLCSPEEAYSLKI